MVMKQKIYLNLCLLAIVGLTACGKKSKPPTAVVTPTPIAISTPTSVTSPSIAPPVTSQPTPETPPVVLFPVPSKVPTPKVLPSTPAIAALPKSIYPTPTPIAIPVVPAPVKIAANPKPEPISKLNIPTDPAQQITPVGIGGAKIGMSLKDLKAHMGKGFEFPVKTSFIEGFDAIAVTKAGTVQYYIPYPTGTQFTDADRIQHLMTDNPDYRTEQGVGPGTPIKQAASVYGDATLSLSKENESREFINFTQHPNGLAFRPKPAKTRTFAGEYPESNEEYLKTEKYDKQAAIGQITVSCPDDQCEPEH
jgi:predicted small lipoprotein YifL